MTVRETKRRVSPFVIIAACIGVWACAHDVQAEPEYGKMVRTMLDTLIEKGRDRYGQKDSPLFAANLSVETLECLQEPKLYYTTGPRILGGRVKRRSPGGSNLYFDQATFKAMELMSDVTGDPKYSQAVLDAIRFQLHHAVDSKGFPALGGHTYWDFYTDAIDWNKREYHEFWCWPMAWDLWWQADPNKAREYVDLIWEWHVVNKKTGETNRHSDKKSGLAFTFMVGNFISGWAEAAQRTADKKYKQYCEKIAAYHWAQRNPKTDLIPATGTPPAITAPWKRDDQTHFTTMVPTFAHRLITSGRQIGSDEMAKIGRALLDAYAKYGYDNEKGLFYCSLTLEGKPVQPHERRRKTLITGQRNLPIGYLATWKPYVGYQELPLVTAQVYAWAAESVDKKYLKTAQRWADVIEEAWEKRYTGYESWFKYKEALENDPEVLKAYREKDYPYAAPYGLFADHYGRVIQFALTMHRLTDQKKWREFAETVADTACAELWKGHIFVGHVEKNDLYENSDNVGILLHALLQLQHSLNPYPQKKMIPPFF